MILYSVVHGGRFPPDHEQRFSLVVSPRSFRMGFGPLSEASLRALSLTTRFLVVLTATTRLREFKALSSVLPFVGSDACLAYVPQFGAQSESLAHSIPRSFLVESLSDFAEGLVDDLLLCPARALCISLNRSRWSIPFASSPLSRRVFDGGIHPLRQVNLAAGASHLRWVPSEPMGFAVAPPISPYTGPGQSLWSWRPPLGAQVR